MKSIWPKIAAGLMLGLAVIIGLALFADIRAVAHTLTRFYWPYVPAILALTLFNYGLRFLKRPRQVI